MDIKNKGFVIIVAYASLYASQGCKSRKTTAIQPPPPSVAVGLTNNNTINKSVAIDAGSITVRCSGVGNNKEGAIDNAESKVFETLLFNGYPPPAQIAPFIENRSGMTAAANGFINDFFTNQDYKAFITYSSTLSTETTAPQYNLVREMHINLISLRKHLEQNNIIRKFGY